MKLRVLQLHHLFLHLQDPTNHSIQHLPNRCLFLLVNEVAVGLLQVMEDLQVFDVGSGQHPECFHTVLLRLEELFSLCLELGVKVFLGICPYLIVGADRKEENILMRHNS